MKFFFAAITILTSLFTFNTFALTKAAKELVNFETKSNAVAKRSNSLIEIPHFEIPLNMIELDFAKRFSDNFRRHLIFKKNGVPYVRWILNPEDTKWHLELAAYFKAKGLILEKKYYFKGYQTASRSYIVEDPNQEIQFSVKSSTDTTGGNWSDKKQPVGEAIDSRLNADFLFDLQEKLKFDNIVVMDEPAIMKLNPLDQAVVIRDLAEINSEKSGKIYVPGFAVLHEITGRDIALRNGSNDPYSFWTEHYVKAVGKALGELAARTGMQFDSPHSQNFLVELDSNYKPTGRIVLRDLADLYIYQKFIRVVHPDANNYLEKFTQKENIKDYISAGFGPLHGNTMPSWISEAKYERWNEDFFKEFEGTFVKKTGLPLQTFKTSESDIHGRYFLNSYRIKKGSDVVQKFWSNIYHYKTPDGVVSCSYVMRAQ